MLAVEADGAEIMTVEGLAAGREAQPAAAGIPRQGRRPVRLLHAGAARWPRMPSLEANPHPSLDEIQEGLAGNLCRCGCYFQITDAVLSVAEGEHR